LTIPLAIVAPSLYRDSHGPILQAAAPTNGSLLQNETGRPVQTGL
jgi:hypothetical protein